MNIMNYKTIKNKQGTFQSTRYNMVQSFTCERCQSGKTAKVQVRWNQEDGVVKVICNGCYGFLCSQAKAKHKARHAKAKRVKAKHVKTKHDINALS